jgi:hypothetical protein
VSGQCVSGGDGEDSSAAFQQVLLFQVRPRFPLDKAAGHSGQALGLGPALDPAKGHLARRLGLGLIGTLASIIWMWSLAPPPL